MVGINYVIKNEVIIIIITFSLLVLCMSVCVVAIILLLDWIGLDYLDWDTHLAMATFQVAQ